jgi:dCTP deaminase
MRLVTGRALQRLVDSCIHPALKPGRTELDIRLGTKIFVEKDPPSSQRIHVMKYEDWNSHLNEKFIPAHGMSFKAGQFVLAETVEYFDMPPHIQGLMTLRSWAAKSGLEQSSSLTLKPGWSGKLILELSNSLRNHELFLKPGQDIAQVQFFDISEDLDDDGK